MKTGKILTVGAAAMMLACCGCSSGNGGGSVNPYPSDRAYVVYDGSGKVKYETDNIFAAFIRAGKMSTRSDRYSVWNGKDRKSVV